MNVLMVGVSKERSGGMWTVAENFINSPNFVEQTNLRYVGTATSGSALKRIAHMVKGYFEIVKILTNEKIDIVHVHMAEKGSIFRKGFVVFMANHKGCKTVIQMHAGPIMDWYSRQNALVKYWVKKIFNSPDVFLGLGEFWKKQLVEIIPSNKIKVLYNGVKCSDEKQYSIDGSYITFMGLLKKTKGCYDLVDAISILDHKIPSNIKFVFCGKDEDKVEVYANEKNVSNRIIFTGWIDGQKKNDILKNTMVSVLPSYYEALSMTVLESMAYGIPVVTTRISTMFELLNNDKVLFDPGDINKLGEILSQLIKDDSERNNISALNYERALNLFSIEKINDELLGIYIGLLNE